MKKDGGGVEKRDRGLNTQGRRFPNKFLVGSCNRAFNPKTHHRQAIAGSCAVPCGRADNQLTSDCVFSVYFRFSKLIEVGNSEKNRPCVFQCQGCDAEVLGTAWIGALPTEASGPPSEADAAEVGCQIALSQDVVERASFYSARAPARDANTTLST